MSVSMSVQPNIERLHSWANHINQTFEYIITSAASTGLVTLSFHSITTFVQFQKRYLMSRS